MFDKLFEVPIELSKAEAKSYVKMFVTLDATFHDSKVYFANRNAPDIIGRIVAAHIIMKGTK